MKSPDAEIVGETALGLGEASTGRFRWIILWGLFCATTIGYMDRFLLGILKPSIMHDLRWTEMDYANVIVYFQLAYAVALLSVSRLIDRIGVCAGSFWLLELAQLRQQATVL